jgi:hypothetical protein
VGAGPALVFFAAPETFVLACCMAAEFLYSLTWGYLWKDWRDSGLVRELWQQVNQEILESVGKLDFIRLLKGCWDRKFWSISEESHPDNFVFV